MAPDTATPSNLRRNALANLVGRGGSAVLWLLATPFVLARLGPERFAVWSLYFAFSGYVATLDFGMANSVSRYVALSVARDDRRGLGLVIRRSLALSGGLGLAWCVACLLLRHVLVRAFHVPPALGPEVARSLGVFSVSLAVYLVAQVLNGALVGFRRLDLSNGVFLTGLLVHVVVLAALLANGVGLVGAAAAGLAGQVSSGALGAHLVRRQLARIHDHGHPARVTWKDLLHFGGAIQATTVFGMGQYQTGKVLLPILGKLVWVTQFELGFRVANTIWSLPMLLQGSVMPAIAHASERGVAGLRTLYDWSCRWSFALGGFAFAGLWLLVPPLLTLWLGPGHDSSVPVARALAIAFGVAMLAGPATVVARGGGWPWLETFYFMIGFTTNLLLCLWAIPRYGPWGTALAMGGSYGLAGAWIVIVIHRRLHVPSGAWLLRLALPRLLLPGAAAATLALLWPARPMTGRVPALGEFTLHGLAFLALAIALSWPLGDARHVLETGLARLARRGGGPGGAQAKAGAITADSTPGGAP